MKEFEYERDGFVIRWHVAGPSSKILIDPRVAFGDPHISGVPTWLIKTRFEAGEDIEESSDDFSLEEQQVREALRFEGVGPDTPMAWIH